MGLPAPVSREDEFLAAIHGVLGEIRDRLPAPKEKPSSGPTKVAEPASRPRAGKTASAKEKS